MFNVRPIAGLRPLYSVLEFRPCSVSMSERAERSIIPTSSHQVKLAQVSEQERHGERSHWDELARDERPYDRRRPQDRP